VEDQGLARGGRDAADGALPHGVNPANGQRTLAGSHVLLPSGPCYTFCRCC